MLCRQKEGVGDGRLFPFYLSSELESPAEDKKRRTPINSHYPLLVVIVFAPPSPLVASLARSPTQSRFKNRAASASTQFPFSFLPCSIAGYKDLC